MNYDYKRLTFARSYPKGNPRDAQAGTMSRNVSVSGFMDRDAVAAPVAIPPRLTREKKVVTLVDRDQQLQRQTLRPDE
jgi:hypothetical protein